MDRCSLRASALTFYSILAIVPVVAMAFGVAKGFGFEERLEERVMAALEGHEEVGEKILAFSEGLLEKAQGGLVAGVGIAILLWTVIKVLGNIEKSFNDIWGVKEGRHFGRKFTDYISIMLVCPLLLVVSGSITVVLRAQAEAVVEKVALIGFLGPALLTALKVVPYIFGWAAFAFAYAFMPNTKVQLRSALVGGVVAGTIFEVVKWLYLAFQIGVTKYSAIYGSFAALPLFLIWMQTSWLVVLFGAELSFAHQNVETYEFEPDCLRVSPSFKRLLSLRTAQHLVRNFAGGAPPATAKEMSHELGAPIRLVNDILYELVGAGVLSEAKIDDGKEVGYQPARPIATLTTGSVLDALDRHGTDDLPVVESEELARLSECLDGFREAVNASPANVPLSEL